jgi:hypothetical protein
MIKIIIAVGRAVLIANVLSACAGPTPTPIVDMAGVDPVVYNRDLAQCVKENASKAIVLGNGVTECMKGKGYRVLVGY